MALRVVNISIIVCRVTYLIDRSIVKRKMPKLVMYPGSMSGFSNSIR